MLPLFSNKKWQQKLATFCLSFQVRVALDLFISWPVTADMVSALVSRPLWIIKAESTQLHVNSCTCLLCDLPPPLFLSLLYLALFICLSPGSSAPRLSTYVLPECFCYSAVLSALCLSSCTSPSSHGRHGLLFARSCAQLCMSKTVLWRWNGEPVNGICCYFFFYEPVSLVFG